MLNSPKTKLDLEAWAKFRPQERSNDYEYNLLLYKFKSFFNEVREFQELHSNCSVTKASLNSSVEPPIFGQSASTPKDSSSLPTSVNTSRFFIPISTNPKGNKQYSSTDKKSYLQHQHSVPIVNGSSTRDSFNNISPQQQAHNSLNNSSSSISQKNRPEIKQRGHVSGSKFLLSKSSERLDNINNNQPVLSSSLKNKNIDTYRSTNPPIPRDDKYLHNEDNIYDAVSSDDAQISETPSDTNSSINNLNRLSLPQKVRLESSKSSLGLGSSADTSRSTSYGSKGVSMTKSSPSQNNETMERSNNSFGSSIILDSNNSNTGLSMLNSLNKYSVDSPQYANYVNIDFFLKRSNSPSYDGLDEDVTNEESSDDSEADTAQLTHSLSSDQLCEDVLKNMSTRELAKKLSNKDTNLSISNSITPASSGDFLDETPSSSAKISSHITKQNEQSSGNKLSSFLSTSNNNNTGSGDSSNFLKTSSVHRENTNKISPSHAPLLDAIQEVKSDLNPADYSSTSDKIQRGESDENALVEAQNTMRSFLSDLNLSPVDDVFEDKAQRRIVKESFAVEFCGRRKLRHLFLFNDVIVCAKYQASSKQKFTFDVKWYLNLNGVSIVDTNDVNNQVKYDKEAIENQILAIRTNLMLLRGQLQQIKRSKHKQPSKLIKKVKKRRTELEAELVLLLPHLPLVIKHINGKKYTFFLSSNFDKNQWIDSIKFLQTQLPTARGTSTTPSSSELQAWIQTCRKNLNPSLGTFLLRSNCDDDLLYGDLYVNLNNIKGITKAGQYYFCFEVDSYGHFSQKASSAVFRIDDSDHDFNEEYIFPLDGAHTLRILLYEDVGLNAKPPVIGKAHIELSRAWFLDKPVEKVILFNSNCSLDTKLSYSSSELLSMRVPHAKLCPTFGMDITQVCKKEKTNVPLLIQLCVNEVERRGMREVGIYRMSGTSTDIQRLKKAFETNPYAAELLLRDIDINSVTGFLKTYLREMPEGLFSNKLYLKFVAAFNTPQSESLERTKKMLELFHKIPATNQHTIIFLVEHLVKIYRYENYNKMSLTNLATVLGPNILRPPADTSATSSSDPFTAVVIGSMSQAGILYFFLNRKFSNLPLTELDSSEMIRLTGGD